METSLLAANAFDTQRVPPGFKEPPEVAVVLPSGKYVDMMRSQSERSFNYHFLMDPSYNLADPISFDADKYVEAALAYCREKKVQGVFGFDCFPAMLAAILKDDLQLPGPSSWSVFLCCNKFYMRRELTPKFGPVTPGTSVPEAFPAVLKVSDTQFYVGTSICETWIAWEAAVEDRKNGIMAAGQQARQQFFFKWGGRLGWPAGWSSADDVQLVHSEAFIKSRGEYQAEVVVLADGGLVMADTGDIEKGEGTNNITLFKTPGTFTLTPALKGWLHGVAGRLAELGFKSGAMDIEFMRLNGDAEAYELVEINSRYSYMGNFIHYGLDGNASTSKKYAESQMPLEVRNLLNRTRLCLGAGPQTLPCRDRPHVAKLAAMIYTDRKGPLDEIFDSKVLAALIADDTLDAFAPKPVYNNGVVTDYDLRQYGGWAKIGCLLMTWEDKEDDINARLDTAVRKLFHGKDLGFLHVRVVDEDGPGPTGLRPSALKLAPEPAKAGCCAIC
mmetsp:Transcript_27209/g.84674  ORF Transcript_27209/g.84674 Transcript_27209/m.84674 type:complete len:500 (+) Transcript_27209:132-1631(+)